MKTNDKVWMQCWCCAIIYQIENTKDYDYLELPVDYKMNGLKVGKWLQEQQHLFMEHKLSHLQLELLRFLRVKWMKECTKDYIKWFHHYEELKQFYKENGTLKMSKATYMDDDTNLFNWKQQQKQLYKKNKLLPYQVEMLEEINFEWETKEQKTNKEKTISSWEDFFKLAKKYYEENGHLLMNESYMVGDIPLGSWVQKQRERYWGTRKNELSTREIRKLESIGMSWKPLAEAKWDFVINLLDEYIKENEGNVKINKGTIYKEFELGKELYPIYQKYKNNQLSKEKVQTLKKLGIR